jgi:hypothetical protein
MHICPCIIISLDAVPLLRQLFCDVRRGIKLDIKINVHRHLRKVPVILFEI